MAWLLRGWPRQRETVCHRKWWQGPPTVLECCWWLSAPRFDTCDQLNSLATRARQNAEQGAISYGASAAAVLPHGGLGLFMVVRL